MDLAGKRALVMGLGTFGGGLGAARYAAKCGAHVAITDLADEQALADSIAALADAPIGAWRLGGHAIEDFRNADAVIVNPAVRPDNPLVASARAAGAEITSEIELFLEACPARVVAVTGSNGKSTTASMLAACLHAGGHRTWLGGNLGGSLLAELPRMRCEDVAVLELSSFQLHWLRESGRPIAEIGVVTNCTPNHLDWHGDWSGYVSAKRRLVVGPRAAPHIILNDACPEVGRWRAELEAARMLSGIDDESIPTLKVPGEHNRQNALLAARAARAFGVRWEAIVAALESFAGLPHRLEFLAELLGRRFYNDSKATTPEAARAALCSVPGPAWLLLGGVDKGGAFEGLLSLAAERARGVACYGAAGPALAAQFRDGRGSCFVHCAQTLRDALSWCWDHSEPGDEIVLSPACASFDQFRNYVHRGQVFRKLVAELRAAHRGA